MTSKLLLLVLLFVSISSIGIPVRMRETKCMIVYTVGEIETIKIEAQFPKIPGKLNEQFYEVSILNTETNEYTSEQYYTGNFKKQLSLVENVIYEVCFRVESDRDFGRVIIQYTAQNFFNVDHKEIKVPDNLLKTGDFKTSYQNAQKLKVVTEKFKQLQTARKESQSSTFTQTTGINKWLMYISVGQIAIIIVTAIYQFFSLQSFLSKKQLI